MVKVALLGCGTMGRTHANAYRTINDAQVVALCDIQSEKGEPLAKMLNAQYFESFDAMLERVEFDVLDVCLPTYLHKEYSVRAMKAGKHVFCEKPIALTVEDANLMVSTAQACGVKFSVGLVVRFFPAYSNAAQIVRSGDIGAPRLIRTTRNQGFPGWSWNNWYQDYTKSGGPEVDLAIHDFDWIIQNFGDVDRVYAKNYGGNKPNQDHTMCILRLKNGAMAHVEASWAYPTGTAFRTTFEIVGTKGQIAYDSVMDAPLVKQTNQKGVHKIDYMNPTLGDTEPYTAELLQFIKHVKDDTTPTVTGHGAVKALKVALAAVESARTGLSVCVDQEATK